MDVGRVIDVKVSRRDDFDDGLAERDSRLRRSEPFGVALPHEERLQSRPIRTKLRFLTCSNPVTPSFYA